MSETMTSMQRVLTALSHKEADRVPLFLLLSLYGARELQMSVKSYFSSHENIIRAQTAMLKKYGSDCIYAFTYAAVETEALGGEVIFTEEGPPNAGEPVIQKDSDIEKIEFPKVRETPCLLKALKAIEALKAFAGGRAPGFRKDTAHYRRR
ncbi:MAG TPA: uroporphyrinogen decarboxylase family protein, partial [Candidatus Wallbacteria bacterium]|nr:uroporphyrinogen decarboxylase family protein [Candidatus Wallbacteria bacterium]